MKLDDLLFAGFNSRVVALTKADGQVVWEWKSPKGSGYVAVLVDQARVFACVDGYTYALDALTGATLWLNPLEGRGTGVPCLATAGAGSSPQSPLAEDYNRRNSAAGAP